MPNCKKAYTTNDFTLRTQFFSSSYDMQCQSYGHKNAKFMTCDIEMEGVKEPELSEVLWGS